MFQHRLFRHIAEADVVQHDVSLQLCGHPDIRGGDLYRKLRERGILVRHFSAERIRDYNRISVGTDEQMETLVRETEKILCKAK